MLQSANQRKRGKEVKHRGASFFETRFFQAPGVLAARVRYVLDDHVFEPVNEADHEVAALIDYLGVNDHPLVDARARHLARLRDVLGDRSLADQQRYLQDHPEERSYPSALQHAFPPAR